MNCKEFENIVNDLAHGRLLDSRVRDDGLTHAERCSQCGVRLENERSLSGLLRALAGTEEDRCASFATETALLEAFRQNAAKRTVDSPRMLLMRAHWGVSAAAVFLVAIAIAGLIYQRMTSPAPAKEELNSSLPKAGMPGAIEKIVAAEERPTVLSPKERRKRKTTPRRTSAPNAPILIRDEMTLYGDDADVVTDFIPLTYGDSLEPIEGGELIRVRLPRTALLKFGLPMNVERAGVPVKADLLVGEDGLAHAIRFVR
jgi:hypothetical protein